MRERRASYSSRARCRQWIPPLRRVPGFTSGWETKRNRAGIGETSLRVPVSTVNFPTAHWKLPEKRERRQETPSPVSERMGRPVSKPPYQLPAEPPATAAAAGVLHDASLHRLPQPPPPLTPGPWLTIPLSPYILFFSVSPWSSPARLPGVTTPLQAQAICYRWGSSRGGRRTGCPHP